MPILKVNNINFYYEIHGQGEPLLLIAGLGVDHFFWYSILEDLKKSYQVILIDNRGIGQTEAPQNNYSTEEMAKDIAELLKQLKLEKINILGHSAGGMIAQKLAILYPQLVKKLILYSTYAKMDARALYPMKINGQLFKAGVDPKIVLENVVLWTYGPSFLSNPENVMQAIEIMMKGASQPPHGFRGQLAACHAHNSEAELKAINAPTLIIHGEDDISSTLKHAEQLVSCIPQTALVQIPEAAHLAHIEQAKKFVSAVNEFCLKKSVTQTASSSNSSDHGQEGGNNKKRKTTLETSSSTASSSSLTADAKKSYYSDTGKNPTTFGTKSAASTAASSSKDEKSPKLHVNH